MRVCVIVCCVAVTVVSGEGPQNPLPAPPILIDSGVSFVRSDRDQRYPSAAFDGTNWLVVWQDERGDREAVWAARVNSAGILLDSGDICIADDADDRIGPRVAFNGTCYLVVWQDGRNHSYDVYGARVSPTGIILDPTGFMISRSNETDEYPAVASNGSDFLVVWQDSRNPGGDKDIYAARVSGAGRVLDTMNIAISTDVAKQEYAAVTGGPGGYLITWQDWRNEPTIAEDIYAARVTTAGVVLDPAGIAVSRAFGSQEYPMLASDGTNFLIVWSDNRNSNGDVYGARVSEAGVVLDPAGLAITTSGSYWQGDPGVAFDGTRYMVVWEDDSLTGGGCCDILAARVTTTGSVLDPEGLVVTADYVNQYWPIVAPGGSNLLIAWQDYRTADDPDIYAVRVSPSGTRLDSADVMLSRVLNIYEQFTPATAFDGANFLTIYSDNRDSTGITRLYGARVSPAGVLLDRGGFPVGGFGTAGAPALSFGTQNYLAAWNVTGGSYGVAAARIMPSGTVLDSNPLYVPLSGSDGGPAAVAFDGANWFVVAAFRDYGGLANVQGARISSAGILLDSQALRMAYAPRGLDAAAVAAGASNYLVVWQDFRSGATYDIYGARVSADGRILDSAGIAISTAATSQYAPSVAFDGTNWLVAWQDNRNGGDRECFCTRVSQSGVVLDPAGVRVGSCPDNYEDATQLLFDGTNYVAVWQWRNYSDGDLWGAHISPSGIVLDTFPVCTAPEYQATPAIARATGGQLLVSYSGWIPTLRGHPAEKMRIWAGIYPFNGVTEGRAAPGTAFSMPAATVVRGILHLPFSPLSTLYSLLSMTGPRSWTCIPARTT